MCLSDYKMKSDVCLSNHKMKGHKMKVIFVRSKDEGDVCQITR